MRFEILKKDAIRQASVVAASKVIVLAIDRTDVVRLIGDPQKIAKVDADKRRQGTQNHETYLMMRGRAWRCVGGLIFSNM